MSNEIVNTKKTLVIREINAIITVMMRDLTVFLKSPSTVILSIGLPLIMMGMIGGNVMQNMVINLDFEFGEFMLIGMLVNMLFMITSMGMTSLVDDHETDFNQEMLVAPVSRYALVSGKILGSMLGAICSITGTLMIGILLGITIPLYHIFVILLLSPIICLSSGAMTMILIGFIKNSKTANMAIMLVLMPQLFLSGTIIPITNTSGLLMVLSRVLPMTYCLDLTRAILYMGTKQYDHMVMFNPWITLLVLSTITTILCLIIGTLFYSKSEKNR